MKRWIPFILTLILAGAGAGIFYWSRLKAAESLTAELGGTGLREGGKNQSATGKAGANSAAGSPEKAAGATGTRVTRNGIRSIIEQSSSFLNMSEEEILALIAAEDFGSSFRSPIAAMKLFSAFTRLAELNPALALAKAAELKGEMGQMATFAAMHEWLLHDRKSAVTWFTSQPEGSLKKREFLQMATFSIGPGDPSIISELSGSMAPGDLREAQKNLIMAKMMSDPDAALKELNKIEDLDERARVKGEAMQMLQFTAPEKAVALALNSPADDPLRAKMPEAVGSWGGRDPKGALDWLAKQPKQIQAEVFDGNKFVGLSFGRATDEDLKATSLRLSDQKQRDQLYAGAAAGQAQSNPSGAFDRLGQVKDKDMQQEAAAQIGRTIGNSGKASDLQTWLDTSPPPATRDTVLSGYVQSVASRDAASAQTYVSQISDSGKKAEALQAIQSQAGNRVKLTN